MNLGATSVMNLGATLHRLNTVEDGFKAAPFQGHEIYSAFQPIYHVTQDRDVSLFGVEALARPHFHGTNISPFHFFNNLKQDLLFPADWSCLIVHLVNAAHLNLGDTKLFVNLNPEYANDTHLTRVALNRFVRIAKKLGIQAENIICEITEQRAANDSTLLELVQIVRSLGGKIAVDDFGEELSDIRRVASLKPDYVKFSRTWLVNMMAETETRALAKATIRQIESMGAKLLFEGVETPAELAWALECNVHYIQGYLLGKPQMTHHLKSLDMLEHPNWQLNAKHVA